MSIDIYTKPFCPYCNRAKSILNKKGIKYKEVDITAGQNFIDEMISRSGGMKTVPQIFIGDFHVGGFDDLWELEKTSKLDKLLKKEK